MAIKLSRNLTLPIDFITERIAFLARTGAGKSGGMRVLFEQYLDAGEFAIFIDPKGDGWGIRASGRGPGYSVLVMGGDHGDVPLESTAGKVIAEFLVKERVSTVLDVSDFGKAEMVRFVTDLASTLYRRNREVVHIFIDEADMVAGEKFYDPKCLEAIQLIQNKGRHRGFGVTVATQRSAMINKTVLFASGTLIAMQTTSPRDVKVIREWLEVVGTPEATKQIVKALPELKPREAFVYSPQILGPKPVRIKFNAFGTFDSMETPKPGKKRRQPKSLADINLDAIKRDMSATIEEAQANDPKLLKARVRELEGQLKKQRPVVDDKAVERAVTARDRHWAGEVRKFEQANGKLVGRLGKIGDLANVNGEATVEIVTPAAASIVDRPPRKPIRPAPPEQNFGSLPRGEAKVLAALIQFPDGLVREQLTVLTGYKRSSRDTYLQRLREKGLVSTDGTKIVATDDGAAALPNAEPLPTGETLQDYWRSRLPPGEKAILDVLIDNHPGLVHRDTLSEITEYKRSSRDTYLQRLKAKQLVVVESGGVRATDNLF